MPNVIAIDDNPSVLDTVVNILEAAGYEAKGVLSGQVGVQLVRDRPPDLVLCDIDMPQVSGYEVLRELRLDPTTSTIPIIFLTALTEHDDMRRGMELGADDYLTKPFTAKELLNAVGAQLKKQQAVAAKLEDTLKLLRKNIAYALPHELRTPLAGIIGYAGVLEADADSLPSDEVRIIAGRIVKAGYRLHRVLENYLVYAQLEIMATDPAQLEALRNHIVPNAGEVIAAQAKQTAEDANRLTDLDLQVENVALQISEGDLKKIIDELVGNGFKFSTSGSAVRLKTTRAANLYALHILDRGHGMSPEQIQNIGAYMQFERMMREQQGLGLGLTIAKRLVELHNGKFDIRSEPNRGTLVRLVFPV
jgi:signal transduction histidine kinase